MKNCHVKFNDNKTSKAIYRVSGKKRTQEMLNIICIFCRSALIFIRHDYESIRSLWWNFQTTRFTELCKSAVPLKKMCQNGHIFNAMEVSVWKQSRMICLNWQKSKFTCSVHVQMHGEARSFHWHFSSQSYRSTTILYTDQRKAVWVAASRRITSCRNGPEWPNIGGWETLAKPTWQPEVWSSDSGDTALERCG